MTKTTIADLLYLPGTAEAKFLPEGPTSLGPSLFSWVAIQHGAEGTVGSLNIFDVETKENRSFELPGRPGFAKPTSNQNQFVVGMERAVGIFDIGTGQWTEWTDQVDVGVEGTIINDGTLYGSNAVFGTKDLEFKTPKAALYLYHGESKKLVKLQGGQICSNGKDVIDSGDGGLALIDIDSPTRKVVRYPLDIDNASVGEPVTVVDVSDLESVPDGMTMSPDEQSVIISFYNPNPAEFGETRQYSLFDGSLEHIWKTPGSPQATCPLLLEMKDGSIKLIITTAVEHMPADRQAESPNAGGLFIAETSFRSPPVSPCYPL